MRTIRRLKVLISVYGVVLLLLLVSIVVFSVLFVLPGDPAQIMLGIKQDAESPSRISSNALFKTMIGEHPYARDEKGSLESVNALTPEDLRQAWSELFARDRLQVAVVGDIQRDEAMKLVATYIGSLPKRDKAAKHLDHLRTLARATGPVLIHVCTVKGKGYAPAETSADKYHGVAKFDVVSGAQQKSK